MENQKIKQYEEIEFWDTDYEELQDDEHVLHMWTPLCFEATEDYQFVPKSNFFKIVSFGILFAIYPLLCVFHKVMYGVKIEGKENLKKIKGAKITVSNHIHPMDCTINAMANFPNKMYFPTLEENFQIPIIRDVIKLLNAIPIPNNIKAKKQFMKAVEELLQKGKTIHIYPEAAMRPYCKRLRNFKKGAFEFAVEQNVPIIPFVYTFDKPVKIYRYFKKKPLIHLTILEPIYPTKEKTKGESVLKMRQQVYEKMKEKIQNVKD